MYGFTLLVKTEMSEKEGQILVLIVFSFRAKATLNTLYNKCLMVKDPETAAMNFLRALEKLPGFIKQEQEKISEIQKDLPVLQEVLNSAWSKESRLSELKTELAAVERKIQLSLIPESKTDAPEQTGKQKEAPKVQESIVRTKGIHLPRGVL